MWADGHIGPNELGGVALLIHMPSQLMLGGPLALAVGKELGKAVAHAGDAQALVVRCEGQQGAAGFWPLGIEFLAHGIEQWARQRCARLECL